ncbi:uncharacterized protein KY384_007798 [Bacidia gigantensis]|uniref:uncharacterized protein n=1 Tax=Bacidia gigantensis TaxID=2732470 RepID=UPI001D03EADA|nr:uncharacterized protein KY384_007798 [Bacidia gigantensis]KAG8527645.1 hypothetical protein KY384_007798 [Bacidia gigantensis]
MKHEIDQVVIVARHPYLFHFADFEADMAIDEERLKTDNQTLITNLRERTRKHQQTQELYDRLKRKQMTTATQHAAKNAAFESVEETYGSDSSGRRPYNGRPLHQPTMQHYSPHHEANPTQSRDESSNREHEIPGMMPPPIPQRSGIHGNHKSRTNSYVFLDES